MMRFDCPVSGGGDGNNGRFKETLSITKLNVLINIACVCVVETFFL